MPPKDRALATSATLPPEPQLSRRLAVELEVLTERGLPAQMVVSPDLITEAQASLAAYKRLAAPVTPQAIDAWLLGLGGAVSNPPADKDFGRRLDAVYMAMGDLAAGAWTADTLRTAMRRFKYWPSVAELGDYLCPISDRLRRMERQLSALANAAPRAQQMPPAEPPIDPEILELVARAKAEGVWVSSLLAQAQRTVRMPHPPRQNRFGSDKGTNDNVVRLDAPLPAVPATMADVVRLHRQRVMHSTGGAQAAPLAPPLDHSQALAPDEPDGAA